MSSTKQSQTGSIPIFARILEHTGLRTLYHSSIDVKLLCIQPGVRLFAYGAYTLVLVSFWRELDISQNYIELFMTLTLFDDVGISFVLACFADGIGRNGNEIEPVRAVEESTIAHIVTPKQRGDIYA
ncbi:uncharacterized protein J7T54_001252 [Emericellopsis cladophorae]|uniref:Uncharacterized protein n=1 Tax=Emericellopsis cladophorae TaxID=2686198 RepID=A0A9P9Y305_9HYPO|nr:uncharacterized protein J7T54_001252 [Emericellopsis cladophorae]KAI6782395.1 hypothetical protein J7T54_001252 [Emericellopsis cladophorae]